MSETIVQDLTAEQEAKLEDYYQKWVNIGLATDRFTEEKATQIVHDYQRLVLGDEPTPVIVVDTPIEAWREACKQDLMSETTLNSGEFKDAQKQMLDALRDTLIVRLFGVELPARPAPQDEVEAAWLECLTPYVDAQALAYKDTVVALNDGDSKASTPKDWTKKVWAEAVSMVTEETQQSFLELFAEFVKDHIKEFVFPYQDGSFFSPFFSFYDTVVSEGIVELTPELKEKFDAWLATAQLGLIYPLEHCCVVCQKPAKINVNDAGFLHSEEEMALFYAGKGGEPQCGFYALNGTTVPKELALTPAADLPISMYTGLTNADVQMEFVRKYGADRMLEFGTLLDSYEKYNEDKYPWWHASKYELWDMTSLFPGLDYQPYLKMLNQTTGVWCFEPCGPTCRTVADAVCERSHGIDMDIVVIA